MKRAFVAQVRPERVEEYRRLHAEPWPQVIALLRAANLSDYLIFFDESRCLLFARWTYGGADFEGDMARLRADPIAQEWHRTTQACLIPVGDGNDTWTPIEAVFDLP